MSKPRADRTSDGRRRGEFVAVGVGIGGVGQTTLEAAAHMRRADKLFYCVVDTAVELWLKELNPAAESLAPLYREGRDRAETYADMVEAFVTSVRAGHSTCAAFYGHPGVLVEATHTTIRKLRREGYSARMVPGVSADGCLFADALVNPGDHGMQTYEASRFVYRRCVWNPRSGLILWQIGVLGRTDWTAKHKQDPKRLGDLYAALRRRYPDDHTVVLYFASTFPCTPSQVRRFRLRDLPRKRVYPLEMLYVPPIGPFDART